MRDMGHTYPGCSDDLDRFGNCWTCAERQRKETEDILLKSLTNEQRILFEVYKEADSQYTSMIIRD